MKPVNNAFGMLCNFPISSQGFFLLCWVSFYNLLLHLLENKLTCKTENYYCIVMPFHILFFKNFSLINHSFWFQVRWLISWLWHLTVLDKLLSLKNWLKSSLELQLYNLSGGYWISMKKIKQMLILFLVYLL